MKFIKIPVDSAEKIVEQHKFLLKEALRAASYHQEQIDSLSKAVKDVTFMLDESKQSLPGSDTGPIGESSSSAPKATEVGGPAAPEEVRKNLVETLQQHEARHGKFDIAVETIVDFLLVR
jgi:hypothetical protein